MSTPVVTLLTDFGTRDATVTVAKAMLMQYMPDGTPIIDISHHVYLYDLQQAAYLTLSAYRHFPKGTVHLLAVDIFAGQSPVMMLAEKDGYYFLAPDNGLLAMLFPDIKQALLCAAFNKPYSFNDWMRAAGAVMHTIATQHKLNHYKLHDVSHLHRPLQTRILPNGLQCNILYIDRYENVVLNLNREEFAQLIGNRAFKIQVPGKLDFSNQYLSAKKAIKSTSLQPPPKHIITSVSDNYNAVPRGIPICRFNEAGYLEIAINHDQAATRLLGEDCRNNLHYKTIDIWVEQQV
jgi:hypothetical protein